MHQSFDAKDTIQMHTWGREKGFGLTLSVLASTVGEEEHKKISVIVWKTKHGNQPPGILRKTRKTTKNSSSKTRQMIKPSSLR